MNLWKAFFIAAVSWTSCVEAEAQMRPEAASSIEMQASNATDLRGPKIGMGVVHDGYVYVMVENELALVIPLGELDFELVHGKAVSSFVTEDNVAYIIIIEKKVY